MAKILVVDDSNTLRSQLREELTTAGYSVLEAEDGAVALGVMEKTPDVDLIICDVNMPVMDGITFITQLTQKVGGPKYPVLMLTTEAGSELKAQAKSLGVVAWITKPYVPEKLIPGVAKLLSRGPTAKAA